MKQEMCNESQNAEQVNDVLKTGKSVAEKFIVTPKTYHNMSNSMTPPFPMPEKTLHR